MDKTAFNEVNERPVAKWMKKISSNGGEVVMCDVVHTQADIDANDTRRALWSCSFPRSQVYVSCGDDNGQYNDSSNDTTPIKKTGMQLLNLNAASEGDVALIIRGKLVDANAVIATACKIKSRDNAAEVIAKADFDPNKFHWVSINIRCRSLRVRFLTFADMIQLLTIIPMECRDNAAYQKVVEIVTQLISGDMSLCVGTKARSKMYNAYVSDLLMKLEHTIRNSGREIPPFGFVYAMFNPAWPTSLKLGKTYDISQRICNLNTGCRTDHIAVIVVPSFEHGRDEDLAHAHFAAHRANREFFDSPDLASFQAFQDSVAAFYKGIERRFYNELQELQSRA
jgi:hypothetical protein